jgi:hypothetical protein
MCPSGPNGRILWGFNFNCGEKKMKKFIPALIVLIILMVSVPSFATVVFTMRDLGNYKVELSYDASTSGSLVSGFALNINVSEGQIIDLISVNDDYWVYPGNIIVIGGGGPVGTAGTPVAGGLGTNRVTIEMGALYNRETGTPPAISAPLVVFTVNRECNITIDDNTGAGGVVLENDTKANIYSTPFHMIPEPATVIFFALSIAGLKFRKTSR